MEVGLECHDFNVQLKSTIKLMSAMVSIRGSLFCVNEYHGFNTTLIS